MTVSLDDADRALLRLLAKNARAPASELARRVGLARSTVQARIERLEREGVIRGYAALIDSQAGGQVRAYVLVQIEQRLSAAVSATLTRIPTVESLHTTSGRFDLVAQIAAASTAELDAALDVIGRTEGVRAMETLVQLSTKLDRRG